MRGRLLPKRTLSQQRHMFERHGGCSACEASTVAARAIRLGWWFGFGFDDCFCSETGNYSKPFRGKRGIDPKPWRAKLRPGNGTGGPRRLVPLGLNKRRIGLLCLLIGPRELCGLNGFPFKLNPLSCRTEVGQVHSIRSGSTSPLGASATCTEVKAVVRHSPLGKKEGAVNCLAQIMSTFPMLL